MIPEPAARKEVCQDCTAEGAILAYAEVQNFERGGGIGGWGLGRKWDMAVDPPSRSSIDVNHGRACDGGFGRRWLCRKS